MRKVKQSGGVERWVGSMWWESERKAASYKAVEGCVKVAAEGLGGAML